MENKEYYFTVSVKQKANTVLAHYIFPKAHYKKEAKRKTELALDNSGIDYDYVRVGNPFSLNDLPKNIRTEIKKTDHSSTLYLSGTLQFKDVRIKDVVDVSKKKWITIVDINDGERKDFDK